ncbi:hypothetical protein KUCAC02_032323, partial [Chaenocephalus aceratus]
EHYMLLMPVGTVMAVKCKVVTAATSFAMIAENTTTRPFSPRRSLPSCVSDRSSVRGLALELAANAEAP